MSSASAGAYPQFGALGELQPDQPTDQTVGLSFSHLAKLQLNIFIPPNENLLVVLGIWSGSSDSCCHLIGFVCVWGKLRKRGIKVVHFELCLLFSSLLPKQTLLLTNYFWGLSWGKPFSIALHIYCFNELPLKPRKLIREIKLLQYNTNKKPRLSLYMAIISWLR